MKSVKLLYLVFLLSVICLLCGCWNYREIERLAIASGLSLDSLEDKIVLNIEIANPASGQGEGTVKPVLLKSEGKTVFDAVREIIAKSGMKVYWSHAKVLLLGEEMFNGKLIGALDWAFRDAETREDMWVLVAKGRKASEILGSKPELEELVSFQLDATLRSQRFISRFPSVELWKLIDDMTSRENTAILPAVRLIDEKGKTVPLIEGCAVIKKQKLLGWLTAEETKALLWIRDELKGGLTIIEKVGSPDTNVTLEIFESKTTVKPVFEEGRLSMAVTIKLSVEIAEISSSMDVIKPDGMKLLTAEGKKQIKRDIEKVVKKAQKEFKCDILGFGSKVKAEMPDIWREVEPDWDEYLQDMEVEVSVDLEIRGSATTSKPIMIED